MEKDNDMFLDGFNTINSMTTKTSNPTIADINPDELMKVLNTDSTNNDSFADADADMPDAIKEILKEDSSLKITGATDFSDLASKNNDKKLEVDVEDIIEEQTKQNSTIDSSTDLGEYEEQVADFFMDKFYEELGWEADNDKPKDVKGIIDVLKKVIDENSKPIYPDDKVEKLAQFVADGGKFEDFYDKAVVGRVNLDNVDIESETHQKSILREDLYNKGFKEVQIEKKLKRLEDAGMLQDEAEEALESVKEYRVELEQKLLSEQKNQKLQYQKQQQTFFDNVDKTIKEINTIPASKKKDLLEYVFKPESDGQTKFFKETGMIITHSTNPKRLLETAYFTKEGEALVKEIERKVESKAAKKLKDTLSSSKETRAYNQTSENPRSRDIFSSLSSQLLPK